MWINVYLQRAAVVFSICFPQRNLSCEWVRVIMFNYIGDASCNFLPFTSFSRRHERYLSIFTTPNRTHIVCGFVKQREVWELCVNCPKSESMVVRCRVRFIGRQRAAAAFREAALTAATLALPASPLPTRRPPYLELPVLPIILCGEWKQSRDRRDRTTSHKVVAVFSSNRVFCRLEISHITTWCPPSLYLHKSSFI